MQNLLSGYRKGPRPSAGYQKLFLTNQNNSQITKSNLVRAKNIFVSVPKEIIFLAKAKNIFLSVPKYYDSERNLLEILGKSKTFWGLSKSYFGKYNKPFWHHQPQ